MRTKKTSSSSGQGADPIPAAQQSADKTSKGTLSPNEILIAEFEYAANSAFQANEDRSKVASFFLVAVGSLVAAILSAQFDGHNAKTDLVFAVVFLVLTIFGGLTIAQLARLRAAWHETALTMNSIKDYYTEQFSSIQIGDAFRWKTKTLPPITKLDSISFLMAMEVALLGGLTLGACVYFLQSSLANKYWLKNFPGVAIVTVAGFTIGFLILFLCYWLILKNLQKKEEEKNKNE